MSLVNQVLKDLEQRHASQAQVEELGIENLHYVPTAHVPAKESNKWPLVAISFLVLSIAVVMGAYYVFKWAQPDSSAQVVVPTVATVPPPAIAETAKQQMTAVTEVQVAATPVDAVSPAMPTITHTPTQSKAKIETANADKPVAKVKKPSPVVADAQPGAMQKSMVPLRSEQRVELAYQEGHQYITSHHYRKAETALRSALALEPGHIKAREMLVGVYISQGRWIEASELLRNGVAIAPQHNTFTKLYARSLMELKRDRQAIEVLSSNKPAVAQDPEHYAILAALYQRQANHSAAIRTYSDILKIRPQVGIWWVGMGISLEALGERQQAVEAYQQARKSGALNGDVARYTDNRLLALDAINYPID